MACHGAWFKTPALLAILVCFTIKLAASDFEVCNLGKNPTVYKFTQANCPFGVLFNQPISAYCMGSTNSPDHFFSSVCDSDNFAINPDERPYKVQLAFHMNPDSIEDQTCEGEGPDKCNATSAVEATPSTLTEPEEDDDDTEEDLTDEEIARQNDTLVLDQTERLFKFMFGLTEDPQANGPNMRIAKILAQSFEILAKFCDTSYVSVDFGKDILKAFLFLVRESEISGIQDISVADYDSIKLALDACQGKPPSFNIVGKTCKTYATVRSVEKMGETFRYTKDEFGFKWGKYDIVVDAAWSALNFVHGLCYGNYWSYVNFHHLFQRAVERLFTKEILYRWNHPPKLYHEDLWDHLYSASVKNTLHNLDVCVFAAYRDAPFVHRLERPLRMRNMNSTGKRTKRETSAASLDDGGLAGAGWCFQSEQDLMKTTEAYVNIKCPESTKAFDEMQRIRDYLRSTNDTTTEGDPDPNADPNDPNAEPDPNDPNADPNDPNAEPDPNDPNADPGRIGK